MTEQTVSEKKALLPDQSPAKASQAFGGRTDGCVGLDLGLAPTSFPTSSQFADEAAPDSLGAKGGGVFVQRTNVPIPPPKEHPFRKRMREAAEKRDADKAAKEARETGSPSPEAVAAGAEESLPAILDAEFVEKSEQAEATAS